MERGLNSRGEARRDVLLVCNVVKGHEHREAAYLHVSKRNVCVSAWHECAYGHVQKACACRWQ